jgi:hypothetical protein
MSVKSGTNSSDIYGVFTLERQDLVDLSRRIAECIPDGFLQDKDKPVVISVGGSYRCGKKIIADFGRAAILDVEHDDINFDRHYPRPNIFQKVANIARLWFDDPSKPVHVISKGQDVRCRGTEQFDEYVSTGHEGHETEVSFINAAWNHGYVFGDEGNGAACYEKHLAQRVAGGIAYIHNINLAAVRPDIEITLESGAGSTCLGGKPRLCLDVNRALKSCGEGDLFTNFNEWSRFVTVQFNNAALDQSGKMAAILKDEFGFCALKSIPQSILSVTKEVDECDQANIMHIDKADFPLAKKHAKLLRDAIAIKSSLVPEERAINTPAPRLDKAPM